MLSIDLTELQNKWRMLAELESQSTVVGEPLGFGHLCRFSEQVLALFPVFVHLFTMKEQL